MEEHLFVERCKLMMHRQNSETVAGEVWGYMQLRGRAVNDTTEQIILGVGHRPLAQSSVRISVNYLYLDGERGRRRRQMFGGTCNYYR